MDLNEVRKIAGLQISEGSDSQKLIAIAKRHQLDTSNPDIMAALSEAFDAGRSFEINLSQRG